MAVPTNLPSSVVPGATGHFVDSSVVHKSLNDITSNESFCRIARDPELLIHGPITRNADGLVTSASVVWPDGVAGTFQPTYSSTFSGVVDSYTITYGTTATYTQPKIIRDSTGLAVNVPLIRKELTTIRAAFYYPWFTGGSNPSYPGAWNQTTYPWTQFHPKRGYYDSANTSIIDAHIGDLVYGKFNAGIASWWGAGSREDGVIASLLDRARGTGFQWCLYYEMEGNTTSTPGSPNPSTSQIVSDLNYISTNYTGHPSYLHVGGKPVIFVYGGPEDDNTVTTDITQRMAARWYNAVRQTTQSWYTNLKVYNGYTTDLATYPSDSWHQYAPASAVQTQGTYAQTLSPRFWRGDNQPPFLTELTRATWQTNVRGLVAGNQKWKLVTSYNEWGEGHSVEAATGPSSADTGTNPNRVYAGTGWASPSGYGWLLDDLHNDGIA